MAGTQATRLVATRHSTYKKNGTKAYVSAMIKHSIKPTRGRYQWSTKHKKHVRHSADGTTDDIPANDVQKDAMYNVPCKIGGQTLNLDFDTGSSDLWVLSTLLSQKALQEAKANSHNIYDPKKSSTSKTLQGYSWQIQYGDNSTADGTVCTDNLEVGNITVEAQAIEMAHDASDSFLQNGSDGLMGLAFDQLNSCTPQQVKTPVTNMVAQGDISKEKELFTCFLDSYKDEGAAFYTFGEIDDTLIQGREIVYTDVDSSNGFWQFKCPSMNLNGTQQALSITDAIMDSGTTLLLIPRADCEKIYAGWAEWNDQAQGFVFDADTPLDKMADLSFEFGTGIITFQKEYFAFTQDPDTNLMYAGCQPSDGSPTMIFGDQMMHQTYIIWDASKPQLGCVDDVTLADSQPTK